MKEKLFRMLTVFGCQDIPCTMNRFLNDEIFYKEILNELLRDPGFERLGKELGESNAKTAFETAHMLKGIIANCGLTPMLCTITTIVEPLRTGNSDGLLPAYQRLLEQRKQLIHLLANV